jgi:hypothetical protein
MNRTFLSAASLFIVVFSFIACDRTAEGPRFITAPGKFELFHKQMTVEVVETPDGDVNYAVTRGTGKVGPTKPPIRKSNGWFIYAATADAVWSYHGDNDVLLIEFFDKGSKFTSNSAVPDLLQRAPAAFLDHLPKEMKVK